MTRSSRDIKSPVKVQIANALQFTQAEHSQEEIDVFLGQVKSILNTENPESRFYTHSSEYHEFVKHVIGKAIFANQVGLVKSLLEDDHGYGFRYDAILKNMPEHSRYEDKYSLMEAAVLAGNLEIVKLIDAAIKRRHPDPSEYPHRELIQKLNYQGISLAVRTGNLDIVNYFLNKGASIDTVVDIYSYRKDTLIAHAAKHGHAQVLDALMAHATFNSISYAFGHMDDKYKDPIRYGRENLEQYSDEKRQEIIAKIAVRDEKFGEYEAELTKFDTEKQKNPPCFVQTKLNLQKSSKLYLIMR